MLAFSSFDRMLIGKEAGGTVLFGYHYPTRHNRSTDGFRNLGRCLHYICTLCLQFGFVQIAKKTKMYKELIAEFIVREIYVKAGLRILVTQDLFL